MMRYHFIGPAGRKTSALPLSEEVDAVIRDVRVAGWLASMAVAREFFGFALGRVWIVLEPLLQALTYWVLLKHIFNVTGAGVSFATFFAAATFWRSHATMVIGSTRLVADSAKFAGSDISLRVPFLTFLFEEVISFAIRLMVLLVFLVVAGYSLSIATLYLGYIAIVQFTFTMALATWLSVAGGMFRDVARLAGHAVWLWWYFSPGLYTIAQIPSEVRWLYDLNPFAHLFPALIAAVTEGRIVNVEELTRILFFSLVAIVPGGLLAGRMKQRILFRV